MTPSNIFKLLLFCFIVFSVAACSKSEAQQEFEEEALRAPSGITAMDASGSQTNEETDPNDWRTAPDFSGLFAVETAAFPNPVSFNSTFEIVVDVKFLDAINGLTVYVFQLPNELSSANPLEIMQGSLQPGFKSIRISPQEFARSGGTGTIDNIYRIIIFDGRQSVITYGDVLVE